MKKKSASNNTSTLSAKRAAAGRKGRGVNAFTPKRGRGSDFQLHEPIRYKGDPGLQKRIDLVVAMALSDSGPGQDVMNSYHKLRFHSSGLKVRRVG